VRLSEIKKMVFRLPADSPEQAAARAKSERMQAMRWEAFLAGLAEQARTQEELSRQTRQLNPHLDIKHFREYAILFLDATRFILEFRLQGSRHPEWEQLAAQIPAPLSKPLIELRAAQEAEREAQWKIEQAETGVLVGDVIDKARQRPTSFKKELRDELRAASARLKRATEDANATAAQRSTAEADLLRSWSLGAAPSFRELRKHYANLCVKHELNLCALNRTGFRFHSWRATSACELLLSVADDVLHLLGHDETPEDYMLIDRLRKKLAALDRVAWKELGIAVRCEVAALVKGGPVLLATPDVDQCERPPTTATSDSDWVLASTLVDKNEPCLRGVRDVVRFCKKQKVDTRQGRTNAGQPHPRRREVHLPSFNEVLVRYRTEQRHLQDAADQALTEKQLRGKGKS